MTMTPDLLSPLPPRDCASRDWARHAIDMLMGDARRSADTHLIRPEFKALDGISIYLKDESTHPTGSLKHRLARSLFLYGICNGRIRPGTTLVEASSGSTAVSEAYWPICWTCRSWPSCRGPPAARRSPPSNASAGAAILSTMPGEVYEAARAAGSTRRTAHYLDQFTIAERATDWRGNNNIAESIFDQMEAESASGPGHGW